MVAHQYVNQSDPTMAPKYGFDNVEYCQVNIDSDYLVKGITTRAWIHRCNKLKILRERSFAVPHEKSQFLWTQVVGAILLKLFGRTQVIHLRTTHLNVPK